MMDWNIVESDEERSLAALNRYAAASAPDEVFLDDMQQRINAARRARPLQRDSHGPLRVLLLGYNGAGNTGADLRTIETIRQLKRLFASDERGEPRITLFALGNLFDDPVLAGTPRLVSSLAYLPDALDAAIRDADLVLNVEGSTYTSKFSDSLAGVLIGGVALAHAHGVAAIAYGVDSGALSTPLTRFVERNAGAGEVICRNEAARIQLASLGVAARVGADTAWTYRVPSRSIAAASRRVALCPNNPYWWPVHADAARARELDARNVFSALRYGPLHFHSWDEARGSAYHAYLDRYAEVAVNLREQGYTPMLVGMEQLDRQACDDLAARLPFAVDIVARGPSALADVCAAVAHADCVVTTRYHAAVLAISHGVPTFGVSMDTRIERLLGEIGFAQWTTSCDDARSAHAALEAINTLEQPEKRAALSDAYARYAQQQREHFDAMGERVRAAVAHMMPTRSHA